MHAGFDACNAKPKQALDPSTRIRIFFKPHIFLTTNTKPLKFHLTGDITEAFNNRFTNIGQSLAQEIPSLEIDPLAYVNPVDGVFSFQRINVQKVIKLLKAIDVGKATGLDKILNRLLKSAADVVVVSLTGIFNQSLVNGIFPSDWKLAKGTPIFKNGSKSDLNN